MKDIYTKIQESIDEINEAEMEFAPSCLEMVMKDSKLKSIFKKAKEAFVGIEGIGPHNEIFDNALAGIIVGMNSNDCANLIVPFAFEMHRATRE